MEGWVGSALLAWGMLSGGMWRAARDAGRRTERAWAASALVTFGIGLYLTYPHLRAMRAFVVRTW